MSTLEAVALVTVGSVLILCCVWRETLAARKREQLRLLLTREMAGEGARS